MTTDSYHKDCAIIASPIEHSHLSFLKFGKSSMANLEYEGFISLFSRLGYKCNYCQYFSKSMFFMRNHVRHHRSSKKTFNCEQDDLELFQCTDCDFKTEVFMFLRKHIEDAHNGPTTYVIKSYICKSCSFETYSFLHWFRHDCDNSGKCGSLQMAEQFTCDLCPYKSKRKGFLKRHCFLKHTPRLKSNYKAKTNNGDLKRHKIRKHASEKDIAWFECDQCSYKAKRNSDLKKHKLHRHASEKDINWLECDQCSYKAKRNGHLTSHKRYKHAIIWFECDQCSYKAKLNGDLKRHNIRKHTSAKDIAWFGCDQCSYRTKINRDLKSHKIWKHTSEKDIVWFECDKCSYKTKLNGDLKRHKIRKHALEKDIV